MNPDISVYSSAKTMLAALRAKQISAQDLLELHLEQWQRVNPRINAVIRTDLARARARAKELDALADQDQWVGRLHGLPLTVKDTFDTADMPASAGVLKYAGRDPQDLADATLIARLKQAGAIIWGKTNTPALAVGHHTSNALYGTTCNPYNHDRTSGGSSGGSSAALASGMTPLELGSDIGGSLRIPAHFCGVFALKPSYDLLPMSGHVPPAPGCLVPRDMNVAGPMARNIDDLRLAMQVLSAENLFPDMPQNQDKSHDLSGTRLAIWAAESGFPLGLDCQAALERAEQASLSLGAKTLRSRPDIDSAQMFDTFMRLLLAALSSDIRKEWRFFMAMLRPLAKPFTLFAGMGWARWILYSTLRHADWLEAQTVRAHMKQQAALFFEKFDAILSPVAPIPAFVPKRSGAYIGRYFMLDNDRAPHVLFSCWSAFASLCHLPALTLPAGYNAQGLPVGVQLVGPEGSDARLLALGEALSGALQTFTPPLLQGQARQKPESGTDGGS